MSNTWGQQLILKIALQTSIGRFLVNGCKERVGTERVGKMSGNGYGRKKRDGKINGNGYGLKETEATIGN